MYGMGNWADVADYIGTKTLQEVEAHYLNVYMMSSTSPLPVRPTDRDSPHRHNGALTPAAIRSRPPPLSHGCRARRQSTDIVFDTQDIAQFRSWRKEQQARQDQGTACPRPPVRSRPLAPLTRAPHRSRRVACRT